MATLDLSNDSYETPKDFFTRRNAGDEDVEDLVNKYIAETCADESTGILREPPPKKLKEQNIAGTSKYDYDSEDELLNLQQKYNSKSNEELVSKKEKEVQKQQRLEKREQKKKEVNREKFLKQAFAAANKNTKPGECLKFVTALIDDEVATQEYGSDIIKALQEGDMGYKTQSQIISGTISWTRKVQSHSLDDDKMVLTTVEEDTDHILLIMNAKDFIAHIQENTLCGHIQSLKAVLNKKLTMAIYGLKQFQNQCKKNGQSSVSKTKIDYSLTELQIMCSCTHRLFDTPTDLGLFVGQFTKAVAEIPFKLQRNEKFQKADWFVAVDNRDCVKVDKTGNGLNRLWKQMLTTFPLARLETAEAIAGVYPTVSSLMLAYEQCSSQKEAELLLQDIPIRRAAGPLSSTRKIGPELSKKIHNFYTSVDGDVLL